MTTLFENSDLRLTCTGHWYDFVGGIEVLSDKPMSFFFEEELYPIVDDDGTEYDEYEPAEDETSLADVCYGMSEEQAEDQASESMTRCFTQSREDGWQGFLSDPQQRGWFLALVKNYCPNKLKEIDWAA